MGDDEKPRNWAALARAVTDRRVELGHRTLRSFAEAAGLSTKTLGEIESAKRSSYDRATLIQVERSLKWPPGAVQHVLDGGDAATYRPGAGLAALMPATADPDPSSFLLSRTRDRVVRLLDPAGPLDQKTRLTLSAAISNMLDLVEEPPTAAEQLRDGEAFETFQATIAAHNERQRREPALRERPVER